MIKPNDPKDFNKIGRLFNSIICIYECILYATKNCIFSIEECIVSMFSNFPIRNTKQKPLQANETSMDLEKNKSVSKIKSKNFCF